MDIKSILMGKCRGTLSDLPSYLMGNGSGTGYTRTDLERVFTRSVSAGGASIKPHGRAIVKAVRGNTITWNQEIVDGNFPSADNWTTAGSKLSVSGGIATVTITGTAVTAGIRPSAMPIVTGHKYLFSAEIRATVGSSSAFALSTSYIAPDPKRLGSIDGEWARKTTIVDGARDGNATLQLRTNQNGNTAGNVFQFKNVMFFDLTKIFGAGNEPSTVEEFRAMFPNDYYAYSEPTLLSFNGNGIKSYDTNGNLIGSCTIPTAAYFADGMKSAGTLHDELTPNKAIKRIGAVDLGTIDWKKTSSSDNNAVFYCGVSSTQFKFKGQLVNSKYFWKPGSFSPDTLEDGQIAVANSQEYPVLRVKDSSFNDSTGGEFKSAMSGVMLYYELAESVETEINPPLNLSYIVDNGGEEEVTSAAFSSPLDATINYAVDSAPLAAPRMMMAPTREEKEEGEQNET